MKPRIIRFTRNNENLDRLPDYTLSILVCPKDTGGKLSVMKLMTEAAYSIPPRCHGNEDLILYVCDGEADVQIENHCARLQRRDLIYVPRGCVHSVDFRASTTVLIAYSPGSIIQPIQELANAGIDPFQSDQALREMALWDVIQCTGTGDFVHPLAPHPSHSLVVKCEEGERYWLAGDEYTIKVGGDKTGNRLCVVHFLIPPGGGPIPHIHTRDDEFFYVLLGTAQFYADGSLASGTTGDMAILPRGIPHCFRNLSVDNSEFLTFVSPSGFDDFIRTAGSVSVPGIAPPRPNSEERDRLQSASHRFGVILLPETQW